jgi:predicted nucleotidyltransferase
MTQETAAKIKAELSHIEEAENVVILYACESGSRAWGFESDDSDYDVRFIYLRPTKWYLTIQNKRDVIEKPIDDELDLSGWDVKREIDSLLEAKRSGAELDRGPRNPIISGLLEREFTRLHAETQTPAKTRDPAALDRLFADILKEVNGENIDQEH